MTDGPILTPLWSLQCRCCGNHPSLCHTPASYYCTKFLKGLIYGILKKGSRFRFDLCKKRNISESSDQEIFGGNKSGALCLRHMALCQSFMGP